MPFSFRLTFRQACLLGSAMAFALVIIAVLLQAFADFHPCSLCILQRVVFMALGVVFLLAAWHQPARVGRALYGVILLCLTLIGLFIAARHVWLLHLPAAEQMPCGPGLAYLWENYPIMDSLRFMLQGTTQCSETTELLLGLTLPMWSLLGFSGLFAYILFLLFPRSASQ